MLLPDMDDLFLVFVLGQCGQGILSGTRDQGWLLEPRYTGFYKTSVTLWPILSEVIYDSLFPGNPRAIRSLDIEDWDAFCSPWAHDRFFVNSSFMRYTLFFPRKDEEKFRYTLSQCGLLTGKFLTWFPDPCPFKTKCSRQRPPSLLSLWPPGHPHPWSWGGILAQGGTHPLPPEKGRQKTPLQVMKIGRYS